MISEHKKCVIHSELQSNGCACDFLGFFSFYRYINKVFVMPYDWRMSNVHRPVKEEMKAGGLAGGCSRDSHLIYSTNRVFIP